MALPSSVKIDLVQTDPQLAIAVNGGPLPEDEHLYRGLGGDYKKYLEMRRDPRVRSLLSKRKQSILGRRVVIESQEKRLQERLGRKLLEDNILPKIRYESFCGSLLNTGQIIGFSVLQLNWENKGGLILPSYTYVPQNRFVFAFHEPGNTTILTATNEELDPTEDIVMVQGYELRLLTRRAPFMGERCPKNRFLVYTFDEDGSPWGLGLGYSIYPWQTVKRQAMKSWLMRSDRDGDPPVVGTHPAEYDDKTSQRKAVLDQFESLLRGISPNAWARLPLGFEVKLLTELDASSGAVHQALIDMADRQISYAVFGELAFSDKPTGSLAANSSQVEDRESSLIDADVNLLDEQLEDQLWSPIREYNFSPSSVLLVRRETIADKRAEEQKTQQEAATNSRAARDTSLKAMGFEPTPEYVSSTYEGWTLPTTVTTDLSEPCLEFRAIIDRVLKWQGLEIGVESLPGQVRFPGTSHAKKLRSGYGHIRGFVGADKEALDIYIYAGLLNREEPQGSDRLFQIDQLSLEDGDFDEHKLMAGYESEQAAKDAYLQEMSPDHFGGIQEVTVADLGQYRKVSKQAEFSEPIVLTGAAALLAEREWDAIAVIAPEDIEEALQEMV
jgi:Inorganic Pyrophosphatase/Protein of unknown function (DUF935)